MKEEFALAVVWILLTSRGLGHPFWPLKSLKERQKACFKNDQDLSIVIKSWSVVSLI